MNSDYAYGYCRISQDYSCGSVFSYSSGPSPSPSFAAPYLSHADIKKIVLEVLEEQKKGQKKDEIEVHHCRDEFGKVFAPNRIIEVVSTSERAWLSWGEEQRHCKKLFERRCPFCGESL